MPAAPTHSQRIAKLEADNATLKLMLGFKFLGMSSEQLAAELLKPENELDGGRLPALLSDYQLRAAAIDPLFAEDGIVVQIRQDIERLQSEGSGNLALANQLAAVQTQLKAVDKNLADLQLTISELPPVVVPPVPPPVAVVSSGLIVGESGIFWLPAPHGGGSAIYFESDTNCTGEQRPKDANGNPTRYRQVFGFSQSGDAGGGLHMNIVYPEDGSGPPYIPDPTRFAMSYRLDRQGMMSINIHRAGKEFAPGKYTPVAIHKGQLAVFIPDENGDFTIRLPQGGRLFVEEGKGNDRDPSTGQRITDGHKMTRSRRPVLLGGDVQSAATGGLPGGGGL